jgi:xylulokinase
MIPTLVTADAAGNPVGPAIIWEDSRAHEQAARLRDAFCASAGRPGGDAMYQVTGQWLDGRYLLPMFLRLRAAEPGRAVATRALLGAKDYLFSWLTGQAATDPSTATGAGAYRLRGGGWDDEILAAAASIAGPLPALPPVLPSSAVLPLRAEIASRLGCAPVPVCLGAADSVLGALGLGVRAPGQAAYVAGTSTVILGAAREPRLDPEHRFLVTPMAEHGLWGQEMDLLATGSALRWLAGLLGPDAAGKGLDEPGVLALAAEVEPAHAPVVLPYLSPGEQGALWDPALTGTITGLTLGHDRRHLARGLVNGIVLESRRCLAVLEEGRDTWQPRADLLVAGGSAAAASFRADLADATGRRVIMPAERSADFSARGAALLAAHAADVQLPAGLAPGEPGAAGPAVQAIAISEPDPARTAAWDRLWAEHERARRAISPA